MLSFGNVKKFIHFWREFIFYICTKYVVNMKKILKKHKELVIILLFFFLLVFFMVILAFTFSYFSSKENIKGEITLGEVDFDFSIISGQTDNIMPGDTVDIDVSLQNYVDGKNNLIPFYFRFKLISNASELTFVKPIIDENKYIVGEDYCYYKNKVTVNEKVQIIDGIYFDTQMEQQDADTFELEILVEAVQSEFGAYKEVFPEAPQEWIDVIENS